MTSSPASSTPDVLPLKFPSGLRLTPEQFELFAPRTVRRSGSETSGRNSELLFQLQQYAKASGRWKVFESSGGFRLPDSSVVSPDASPASAGCSCLRSARLRCGLQLVIRNALRVQQYSTHLLNSLV